jgi:hypothetical protein
VPNTCHSSKNVSAKTTNASIAKLNFDKFSLMGAMVLGNQPMSEVLDSLVYVAAKYD